MIRDEICLEKILNEVETQMRKNNIEGFKAAIKNLDKTAIKVLDETESLWETNATSREVKGKFHLLRQYLDYMKRLCKGKV